MAGLDGWVAQTPEETAAWLTLGHHYSLSSEFRQRADRAAVIKLARTKYPEEFERELERAKRLHERIGREKI
jgi:hypothetical protein